MTRGLSHDLAREEAFENAKTVFQFEQGLLSGNHSLRNEALVAYAQTDALVIAQ